MNINLIRFRFFKDLSTGQRQAVFKVFGVLPDDFNERLTHTEESRLLSEIVVGLQTTDAT